MGSATSKVRLRNSASCRLNVENQSRVRNCVKFVGPVNKGIYKTAARILIKPIYSELAVLIELYSLDIRSDWISKLYGK